MARHGGGTVYGFGVPLLNGLGMLQDSGQKLLHRTAATGAGKIARIAMPELDEILRIEHEAAAVLRHELPAEIAAPGAVPDLANVSPGASTSVTTPSDATNAPTILHDMTPPIQVADPHPRHTLGGAFRARKPILNF